LPTQLFFPTEQLKWQELKAYLVRQKEGPNLKRCPVWLDHGPMVVGFVGTRK